MDRIEKLNEFLKDNPADSFVQHALALEYIKLGSDEKAKMVTGIELERLLYGNVLDAYGTDLFGENVARSEKSQALMERLAELNLKELNAGLTKKDKQEQTKLQATLPTAAHRMKQTKRRNGDD